MRLIHRAREYVENLKTVSIVQLSDYESSFGECQPDITGRTAFRRMIPGVVFEYQGDI